ncbi:hypothetical protein EAF04_000556 [Stromatinia cepivora]|nr:hypothetical protein EAF04_000556 [Stromatinia cepivora]
MFLLVQQREAYVNAIKDFCFELSQIEGDRIGSVEGKGIHDYILPLTWPEGVNTYWPKGANLYGAEHIHESWANSGLAPALSEICFSHNSLTPDSIILVEEGRDNPIPTIGVVDWSKGGFVPKSWVRTRFAVDMESDLPTVQKLRTRTRTGIPPTEVHKYRWAVYDGLGEMPYNMPEVRKEYWEARPDYAAMMGRGFVQGWVSLIPTWEDPDADPNDTTS